MSQLTNSLKSLYIRTAQKLKGSDRRQFMAEVVQGLGIGGQSLQVARIGLESANNSERDEGINQWTSARGRLST